MPADKIDSSVSEADRKLERQRAYSSPLSDMDDGTISIADFKPDGKYAKLLARKKREHEADLSDAQKFRFTSQDLRLFVRDLKDAINVEIHEINGKINNIDSSNTEYIEHLRETKAKLTGYKDGLDKIERDRILAESTADLNQGQAKAEVYKTKATRRAKKWRNANGPQQTGPAGFTPPPNGATPTGTNPAGATPPAHGGPSMGYAGAAGNTGETPAEKEARYKAEIKVTLVPLANSTDNSVITNALTALKDHYGQGRVSESIRELRQDTGDSKFDVMLATFQNLVANRPQNPAP